MLGMDPWYSSGGGREGRGKGYRVERDRDRWTKLATNEKKSWQWVASSRVPLAGMCLPGYQAGEPLDSHAARCRPCRVKFLSQFASSAYSILVKDEQEFTSLLRLMDVVVDQQFGDGDAISGQVRYLLPWQHGQCSIGDSDHWPMLERKTGAKREGCQQLTNQNVYCIRIPLPEYRRFHCVPPHVAPTRRETERVRFYLRTHELSGT
ncbi:hypothetical protein M426DRAFT_19900 [Hypoxylon sp. CI-4A]|nr:hypothetical protein M426DRAFT_19900 [Hypoxylon sp. CI-4A]